MHLRRTGGAGISWIRPRRWTSRRSPGRRRARVIMGTGCRGQRDGGARRRTATTGPASDAPGADMGRRLTRREVMAEASTADLGKGKRITGGDRSTLADDLRKRYDGGREHPLAGDVDEPLLRVRPPAAVRVRRDAAQPRWGQPQQQEEGVTPERAARGWVRTAEDGAVLTVTLDRPDQLNAQTPATWSGAGRDRPRRCPTTCGSWWSGARGARSPPAWTAACSTAAPGLEDGLGDVGRMPEEEAQERIRGVPGRLPLAALAGHRLDRGRAGARDRRRLRSSRSPATCASSPRTPRCGCPR